MDKTTAQALTELHDSGRFGEDTTEAIHKALGHEYDEDTGRWVTAEESKPEDDKDQSGATKAAAKGSVR